MRVTDLALAKRKALQLPRSEKVKPPETECRLAPASRARHHANMIALRSLRQGRLGLAAMLATLSAALPDARAHDWYPFECCSARDCAPADSVVRREDGGYMVTARGITVLVPWWFRPWRESPDGRVHICVRQFTGIGPIVICAFRGPGV